MDDRQMKTLGPTLMDVIEPPGNLWLQKLLKGKSGSLPPGVRVVRFEAPEGTDDMDDEPPPPKRKRAADCVAA